MRVAVVHHWFVTRGGGERVAECIAALFPQAEIFTLVENGTSLPESLAGRTLHSSFLQRLPWARTHHRHYLPLFPAAARSLDLRGFDLVLSSDSGPVKGVRLDPGAVQICYCHSPMRYLWDGYESYRRAMDPLTRAAFTLTAGWVRRWDARAAGRVTWFLANSEYVADRIGRFYGRQATVLHPPIDLERAPRPYEVQAGESYLCAGRLVAYKHTELLIEACLQMGRRLRIAGTGPELERLQRLANSSPLITFLGALSDADLWAEYACCRALLFAADEDFGMVALEAQACGRPVLAYGAGGSLETVRARDTVHPTGLFFGQQTTVAVMHAIERFESDLEQRFRPEDARGWASQFSTPRFLEAYRAFVLDHVPETPDAMISADEALYAMSSNAENQPFPALSARESNARGSSESAARAGHGEERELASEEALR